MATEVTVGLDTVELVMALEEEFGVSIPDPEAATMRTPRHIIDWLAARLPLVDDDRCRTQRTFYELRRALLTVHPHLGSAFALDTPLTALTTQAEWPAFWEAARQARRTPVSGDPWPTSIRWPGWLRDGPRTVRELTTALARACPPAPPHEPVTRQQLELRVRKVFYAETLVKDFPIDAEIVRDLKVD